MIRIFFFVVSLLTTACLNSAPPAPPAPAPPAADGLTQDASAPAEDEASRDACFCHFVPDCGAIGCTGGGGVDDPYLSGNFILNTPCEDVDGANTICYCDTGQTLRVPCGLHTELELCTCAR